MYVLEDFLDKLRVHTTERALCSTLVENLVIAYCLKNSHVVLLLVLANLAAHTHTLGKKFHQAVVEFVNLLAQFVNALGGDSLRTHYE